MRDTSWTDPYGRSEAEVERAIDKAARAIMAVVGRRAQAVRRQVRAALAHYASEERVWCNYLGMTDGEMLEEAAAVMLALCVRPRDWDTGYLHDWRLEIGIILDGMCHPAETSRMTETTSLSPG